MTLVASAAGGPFRASMSDFHPVGNRPHIGLVTTPTDWVNFAEYLLCLEVSRMYILLADTAVTPPKKDAVARWEEFLGPGEYTNIHPRTGLPDPNRLVSADGLRSIRFGNHEMGSKPTKSHFHKEAWSFDGASGVWNLQNIVARVPYPKGTW